MLRGNCSAKPEVPESQERVHPGWAAVSAPVARLGEVRAWPLKLGVKRWSSLLAMTSFSSWMTGELWSSSLIMTMKRMMEVMLVVVMVRVGTMLRVIHLLISIYGSYFYLSILSSQRWVEERHRGLGHLPKVPEGRAGVWTQEVKLSEPKCLSTTLHSFSKRWKGRD